MANKVAKGIAWSAIERFSVQGVSFMLSIVIARLVSPSAYGAVAMLNVFLSFSQVFIDSGFANALIQKKDRRDIDFYTTQIYSLVVAAIIYAILFISAPFIADFYANELLCSMLRVISLVLLFSSTSIVQRCRLTLNLDFKTQTKASLFSVIISGIIGVTCAYKGLGAWALVIQSVSNSFMQSFWLIFFSKWIPKFAFSKKSFKALFSFGSKQLIGDIFTSFYMNLTNLLIGKCYTAESLGFYNRGFTLAQFPSSNIVDILYRIIYPVECGLQSNPKELEEAHYKYLRLSCYTVFPLMILICVLSRPIIVALLTEKWEPAAYYLSIMCIAFIWQPMNCQVPLVVNVLGMPGKNLKWGFLRRGLTLLSLIVTLKHGTEAIAWGLAVSNLLEVFICAYVTHRYVGYQYWRQFTSVINIILSSIVMGVLVYFTVMLFDNNIIKIAIGCIVAALSYILFTFALNMPEKNIWLTSLTYLKR